MTGEEIIVTFKEPWYNDYILNYPTAFDMAVDKAFLDLLHDNKDLINITKRYKNHE